ncbi:type VI secretion system baseplate subunit TssF, partial [Escherichia coli]|uniref:type VI secretion system baseplate subunit TssF n=1 Tax=Escherichia coli TaxID=562 RepID=UPI00202D09AC
VGAAVASVGLIPLLHRFFALYADIHLFTQLTLILQPTGKCLQWTEHHSQRVPG